MSTQDPLDPPQAKPVDPGGNGGFRLGKGTMITILSMLGLSLAVNLFIVGMIAGRGTAPQPVALPNGPPPHERIGIVDMRSLFKALPEADQRVLRRGMAQHRRTVMAHSADLRDALTNVSDILAAEALDVDALEASLKSIRDVTDELRAKTQAVVVRMAPELSPEGRRILGRMAARELMGAAGIGAGRPPGPHGGDRDTRRPLLDRELLQERMRERFQDGPPRPPSEGTQ